MINHSNAVLLPAAASDTLPGIFSAISTKNVYYIMERRNG